MEDLQIFGWLASGAAGVAAACLAAAVLDILRQIEVEKLENTEEYRNIPVMFRMAMPFTPNLAPLVKRLFTQSGLEHVNESLQMAGFDGAMSATQFICVRALLLIAGLLFMLLAYLMGNPLIGVLMVVALLIYPPMWLRNSIARRHLEIQKALPTVLDLLTLSVEAGKDFLTALRDITSRRRRDALTVELVRAIREIQLGKQRRTALREMSQRVRQPDLTAVVNAIIQADELGVSIGQLLRIQSDQFRGKRFQRAEKLANEAPVKILGPVVLFIFPAVIIILLAPILIQASRMLAR